MADPARRLSFDELSSTNLRRVKKWHPGFPYRSGPEHWTGADWSNAMQGESGEAGNIVKKLRRLETGTLSRTIETDRVALRYQLSLELADTIIYLDILAQYYEIDLSAAVIEKFNITSAEYGFDDRL